ncbi:hypothetical protein HPB47_010082 [Ixodes persulcatus]|uniref:Uncharacterized protein n=1 Tax=Ixodes persulcatus TaxID=34615 RepID=A0AC60P009_IXOPE|nr:hypothetical protein HPB47_010082 [Ixodes persulcatus]
MHTIYRGLIYRELRKNSEVCSDYAAQSSRRDLFPAAMFGGLNSIAQLNENVALSNRLKATRQPPPTLQQCRRIVAAPGAWTNSSSASRGSKPTSVSKPFGSESAHSSAGPVNFAGSVDVPGTNPVYQGVEPGDGFTMVKLRRRNQGIGGNGKVLERSVCASTTL